MVVSYVVWIRRFNTKRKLLACHLEADVQGNFLLIHSPPKCLTLNQTHRTCVKLSKFENLPHKNIKMAVSPKDPHITNLGLEAEIVMKIISLNPLLSDFVSGHN